MRTSVDPKNTTIKIRIQEDLLKRIEQESKNKSVSVSELIRDAIKEYINYC